MLALVVNVENNFQLLNFLIRAMYDFLLSKASCNSEISVTSFRRDFSCKWEFAFLGGTALSVSRCVIPCKGFIPVRPFQ